MKVTPVSKKFGKHKLGEEFELADRTAKVLIKIGRLEAVTASAPTYETRMMSAAPAYSRSEPVEAAPYGYKADGTPRQRPGRPAKAE